MLYFFTKLKSCRFTFLALFVIFYLLLVALSIIISRKIILLVILLILDILLNLALSFVFYKYNDYFLRLAKMKPTRRNIVSSHLKNSDLAKSASENIAPLGILTSDPYFEAVKQYLTATEGSRPDLLKTPLEETNLKTYDNLLALTTALTTPKSANDKLQTIFLGHTYLDRIEGQ